MDPDLANAPDWAKVLERSGPIAGVVVGSGPAGSTAAVVLAVDRPGAVVAGVEQRADSHHLGARELTRSPSTAAAAVALGLPGSQVDVLEVHAPFSHQAQLVVDALAADIDAVRLAHSDPIMVTGLLRVVAAANAVLDGGAQRVVAHATNGPCLQHNLLCLLETQ